MTRTQQFIEKHKKVLTSGVDFYNPDTSLMQPEDYEKAKCRMLLILPTPHVVKTVSSTVAAINDFVIEHCPGMFIDFAYMPENEDIKRYDDWNVPYAIGNITHLDPSHFDIIGFSISVLNEVVTAPVMLKTFERCDKPIPLFWSQRKDLPLGEQPVIYGGGITAVCGESMFGKVKIGDKVEQAYLDFLYLGDCGQTDILYKRWLEAKETGKVHRTQADHDVPGYPHHDHENFQEVCEVKTIQDYVDCLFDLQEIYQPQAYDVVYNKHNQIIRNVKINPKAQDFVTPFYPHTMLPDLGIGRAVICGNGDNTGTTQTQVSEGAHLKGNRIRTSKGLVRIEDLCSTEVGDSITDGIVDTSEGPGRLYHRFTQGIKPVRIFTLKSGIRIGLTDEHPVEQWHTGEVGTHFVRADELLVGDYFMTKKSDVFGDCLFTTDEAEFLGRMVGDGSYNLYHDSREGHDTPVHKMYLACAWEEKDYCEDLLKRANIAYTLDEKQGRHCRFWIKAVDQKGRSMREFWGFNKEYTKREGKPSVKYIPDTVYSLCEDCMKAFLKGYHDADGCTSTKAGLSKVTFDCCHESIIDDIQQFLLMVGIPSRKHFNEKSRVADADYGFYDTVNEHWSLVISSEYFDKFNALGVNKVAYGRSTKSKEHLPMSENIRELIASADLTTEERSHAYAQVRRGHFTKNLADKCGISYPEGIIFDEIVSIEFYEGETFDLSVQGLEKLTANGCSVHNCSAGGACSFCSEGNYTGGWVEKDEEQIMKELWEAKKYSAGYKYKPYSFNANYVRDYKGKLSKFIQIYPKVTFINMRMEELGRDPDALKMMKLIGSNRISAPMEGMSPRIQNNLLNKCLSEESLTRFMDEMVHAKMTDIKVGGIFTGYEEDEDFQWMCDFVDSFKKRAAEEGGNFPFRLKMTPLVHYPLTPIEYLERKSARASYDGEHWLSDEWYEKFREHEVYFKVNGFRYSTFLEQTFVDLGRSLTPLIYKHFVNETAPIYSLRSCATDEYLADLRALVDKEVYFSDRDPEHYISPCHRIHIELMGSYIPRARRLLRCKKAGNIFDNEPDIRCLKTFEGAQVRCYHTCITKDPLKMYYDVTMDEEGNLHGESYDLTGCQRCPTTERRKERLAREIVQTKNSDDIIATPRIPQVQKVRFVLKRNPEYDVLNPNNTAHTFLTKFLQLSDNLLHSYHSVVCHNMFWQAEPGFKFFTSGYQIVDTMWSKNSIKEIQELIPEVNKLLKSTQVVSAQEILRDEKILITDLNFYTFESTLPRELFDAACHTYKGQIKVEAQVQGFALTETIDSSLERPVFASKNGKTIGCFWIPTKYNPEMYMSGFLSQAKKTSEDGVVTTTNFSCAMTMREAKMPCRNCSKENALISITTGKPMPLGKSCLCKAILTQMIK